MMRQVGSCSGIENYSMHMDGRQRGTAPNTLLDYFPEDFVLVVDESHVAVPQVGGMYEGDMSRKRNLDRKSDVEGKSGSVRGALGGGGRVKKKKRETKYKQ